VNLGIIGLQAAGKTTVFNALTGGTLPTGVAGGAGRPEVHTAVTDVPDARLQALVDLYRPRKVAPAKVTYADVGGFKADLGRQALPGALLNQLAPMDGLLHVVRAFDDPSVPHPLDDVNPARDYERLASELHLTDMLAVDRRLERLAEERQRGGRDKAAVEREIALFQRTESHLAGERPLRELSLRPEETRMLSGFSLLTCKPVLVVLNTAEGSDAPADIPAAHGTGVDVLRLDGKLEMEIAQLGESERQTFLSEYGLSEPGRDRILRASYDLLDWITFFTVSEAEVHAWTLHKGATALQAADAIHSDLARGFIRAEVIAWDELVSLGGLTQARQQGKLRLEGKDYIVRDGEIVHIRFNA
jgi:GTP-binding protein YchF